MKTKPRDWIIAIAYVALIFATLELARLPLAYLRSHGMLRNTLFGLFLISSIGISTILIRNHGLSLWRISVLILLGAVYIKLSNILKTPEEELHFFEYGLVGILFLRALSHENYTAPKKIIGALTLASATGWIDELLQGLTPHRHYDFQDVKLNAISAFLGLATYLIVKNKKTG